MEKREKPLLQSIVGMRGIGCLFIACFHYYCLYIDDRGLGVADLPLAPHSEFFFTYSKNAVELFFMLAGFLTAYHYRDKIIGMSPWVYIKRHYARLLLPSVWVTLWAFANAQIQLHLIPGSAAHVPAITPLRLILSVLMMNTGWFTSSQLTGLPVNSTMWFVDVLLICYLLYYLIRKLARNSYVYLSLSALMVLVGWICLEYTPGVPFLWSLNGRGYAPFFIGVLLCEFQSEAPLSLKKKVSLVWCTLIVGFLIVRLILGFDRVFGEIGTSTYVRYFEFLVAPGLVLAALNLAPVTRLLESKPLLWLGALSTPIYYVHNNLMEDISIVNDLTGSPINFSSFPVFILILTGIVLFVAAASTVGRRMTRRQ